MNASKFFFSTLIAAAAMSVGVYADIGFAGNSGAIQWAESFGDGFDSNNTFTLNNAFHEENGVGVAGGDYANSRVWTTNTGEKFTNAFTFSFELVDFSAANWTDALSLYTNGTTDGTNHSVQLQKSANGDLMVYTDKFTGSNVEGDASNINLGNINDLKGKVITLSFDARGATNTLTAYVDGVANADTVTFTYAEDVTASTALTGFQFGAAFGNNRVSNSVTVDNIVVSNTALTSTAILGLSQGLVEKNLSWAGGGSGSWADATWSDGKSIGNNVIANVTFDSTVTMTTDTNVWLKELNVSDSAILSLVAGKKNGENGEVVLPGTVILSSANSLVLGEGASLNLGEGVVLDLGKDSGGTLNKNIVGAGKVIWVSTPYNHATKLTMRDDFVGTLQLSGNFKSSEASDSFNLGGTSKLVLDGVWFWGNGSTTITADVLLGENKLVAPNTGKGEMHVNSHYFSDGGSITYQKSFDASDKIVTITAGDTSFEGKTTIGTLNFSGGALAFSSDATVGTLSASGKTVTVNGGELSITTSAEIGTLSVGDSGMTLSGAGTKTVGTLSASGKTVTVNGGELSITTSANIGKLSGDGVVDFGSVQFSGGNLSESWTGTVAKSGLGNDTNLSLYVNGKSSWVEIYNSSGYLYGWRDDEDGNISANISLRKTYGENGSEVSSYNWTDGTSNSAMTAVFVGALRGDGTFEKSGNKGQHFVFAGDVSAFEGTFKYTNSNGNSTLTFGGKVDAVEATNAIVLNEKATIAWDNDQNGGHATDVVFNYSNNVEARGTIKGASLVKKGSGVLTLSGNNTYSGGTTISEGALVAAHANALGSGKVTVAKDATLGFVAGTTVTGVNGGIELAEGAKLAVDLSSYDLSQYPILSSDGKPQISLDLVANVAIKYNNVVLDSSNIGEIEIEYDLVGWEKYENAGWASSLAYVGNTLQLTLTIPEPSTFGLLAGLGALTLVGTRRRRKKA
ncbi:MAG: autotransporter-associated beta strand repeat-containing protein [Opitutales bacterium]|nr:autotransporter-associated beta strand repeat-containing protein [Opitutales bacterium]